MVFNVQNQVTSKFNFNQYVFHFAAFWLLVLARLTCVTNNVYSVVCEFVFLCVSVCAHRVDVNLMFSFGLNVFCITTINKPTEDRKKNKKIKIYIFLERTHTFIIVSRRTCFILCKALLWHTQDTVVCFSVGTLVMRNKLMQHTKSYLETSATQHWYTFEHRDQWEFIFCFVCSILILICLIILLMF